MISTAINPKKLSKDHRHVIQRSNAQFVEVICDKGIDKSSATEHVNVIVIPKDGYGALQMFAVTAAGRVVVTVNSGSKEPVAIGLFGTHKKDDHEEYTIDFNSEQYTKVLDDIKHVCEEYTPHPSDDHEDIHDAILVSQRAQQISKTSIQQ